MQCLRPVWLHKNLDKRRFPDGLMVPCGCCVNCKKQRAREWSLRIQHEKLRTNYSIFATLTYGPDRVPKDYGLRKKHLQNFFKRLRKNFENTRIKYYACGEYGDRFARPHYHIILLVYETDREYEEWIPLFDNKGRKIQKGIIEDTWGMGHVQASYLTEGRILYTVSYVDKKIMNYRQIDIGKKQPPFKLSSNGFGRAYVEDNRAVLLKDKAIKDRGKLIGLPRYYKKKLGIPPEEFHRIARSKEFEYAKEYMKKMGFKKMERSHWDAMYADMQRQSAINAEARTRVKTTPRSF